MKRQLNFWSKMRGLPDKDLINTSLSIEDNKFTVRFGRPGSVEPIDQIEIELSDEEALQLKHAFELAGAQVFQDEMDERIYFANIARSKEELSRSQNLAICIAQAVICMIIGALIIKLSVILSLIISLTISILCGIFLRKNIYKESE